MQAHEPEYPLDMLVVDFCGSQMTSDLELLRVVLARVVDLGQRAAAEPKLTSASERDPPKILTRVPVL